jgi:hypothetical protein
LRGAIKTRLRHEWHAISDVRMATSPSPAAFRIVKPEQWCIHQWTWIPPLRRGHDGSRGEVRLPRLLPAIPYSLILHPMCLHADLRPRLARASTVPISLCVRLCHAPVPAQPKSSPLPGGWSATPIRGKSMRMTGNKSMQGLGGWSVSLGRTNFAATAKPSVEF